jgi:hypothetical protein
MSRKAIQKQAIKSVGVLAMLFCLLVSYNAFAQQANSVVDTDLTQAQLAAYAVQAKNSVTDFAGHVKNIADKTISKDLRKNYIKNALILFSEPDNNIVEVSSLKDEARLESPTIRQYLFRLMNLNYTQVNVVWYNIKVSNFVKGRDGNYYATATIIQKFEGVYKQGELNTVKRDLIRKSVQVSIVKKYNTYDGARNVDDWDLKLGDIKVTVASL